MVKKSMTYRWLWSCLISGGLLLAGCDDHPEDESLKQGYTPEEGQPLELVAVTRTAGATQIGNADCPDIRAFLTTPTELVQIGGNNYGTFHYNTTLKGWESNITVKEERQYYLYGYMPAEMAGVSVNVSAPESGKFSDGVNMTLTGLPAFTEDDVCLIVGVERLSDLVSSATTNVQEGNYSYLSGIVDRNYVNLLMGHLYVSLQLSFKLDAEYAKLRSIHLKKVEMTLPKESGKVTATVNLRAGKGIYQPTFDISSSSADITATLLNATAPANEMVLDNRYTQNSLVVNSVYCAPNIFSGGGARLKIRTTYDVYDRTGNTNLGERTAENILQIAASMKSGQQKNVILTVNPTYLYVLSDGDLDNPVITINE
jgi:hypothetical protein